MSSIDAGIIVNLRQKQSHSPIVLVNGCISMF
jgi:hypothetical protein